MDEEPEKKGLHERLDEIEDFMKFGVKGKRKKMKPFRLPFLVRFQQKKIIKKNKILIFFLKTNKQLDIKIAKIENGMLFLNGNYHAIAPDNIYLYKKFPCIILPEWSLDPFSPFGTKDYHDAVENKRIIHPQNIILRAIEAKEASMSQKKVGGKAVIIMLVVGVIAAYLFFAR